LTGKYAGSWTGQYQWILEAKEQNIDFKIFQMIYFYKFHQEVDDARRRGRSAVIQVKFTNLLPLDE
jgi:hypothetical protein